MSSSANTILRTLTRSDSGHLLVVAANVRFAVAFFLGLVVAAFLVFTIDFFADFVVAFSGLGCRSFRLGFSSASWSSNPPQCND